MQPASGRGWDESAASGIAAELDRHRIALADVLEKLAREPSDLAAAANLIVATLAGGGTIWLAGNGGSAAEAQHFAAELIGRFKLDRAPFAALALTTDTSVLTAVANDYCYDDVFARQVEAVGRRGDAFVALSTSGESENLVRAAQVAHRRGMTVVALTGRRPNRLSDLADVAVAVPAADTALIQEVHMTVTHLLCGIVERSAAPAA